MRLLRSALVASSVLALGLTACGTSTPTETTKPTDPAPGGSFENEPKKD